MATASWKGVVLAQSSDIQIVEGNVYFPSNTINKVYLKPSDKHTHCAWKGEASYYDIVVNDEINPAAAWYYPTPLEKADHIKNYVAFWQGVVITE